MFCDPVFPRKLEEECDCVAVLWKLKEEYDCVAEVPCKKGASIL